MGHHPHDMASGKVGDYFEKDGFVAYKYANYTDISSDNASFPEYGYVYEVVTTKTKWVDYLKGKKP